MDAPDLFKMGPPAFYLTTINERDFDTLCLQLLISHQNAVIRMIRGTKSRTLDPFYDEVSAALQFPYYFGENWPAFNECINDMDWLPTDAYLLMVRDANLLLDKAHPAELDTLTRILARTCTDWVNPLQAELRERSTASFHVVFQCDPRWVQRFLDRLQGSGVVPERLVIMGHAPEC